MSSRTKSKSGWGGRREAHLDVRLKPMCTISAHICSFWATVIGSTSAWLPSRRSTAHQSGARSSTQLGHWRSARLMTGAAVFAMIEAHIQIPLTDGRGAGRPGRQAGGAGGSGLAR